MDTVSLSDLPSTAAGPLDALPLANLLNGRRSQQFPAINPEEYGVKLDGAAYEISLDEGDLHDTFNVEPRDDRPQLEPLPLARDDSGPIEISMEAEPTRPPSPLPLADAPPADELDFSSVMEEPSAPRPRLRPLPWRRRRSARRRRPSLTSSIFRR